MCTGENSPVLSAPPPSRLILPLSPANPLPFFISLVALLNARARAGVDGVAEDTAGALACAGYSAVQLGFFPAAAAHFEQAAQALDGSPSPEYSLYHSQFLLPRSYQ